MILDNEPSSGSLPLLLVLDIMCLSVVKSDSYRIIDNCI